MFIPLTINQRREGLPNVLVAGDTAGIFYLLSHLTALEINVFLADTGIRRPLREFPGHRSQSKDRANVYYDFFDRRVGAGVVRRMDVALTASFDLKRWTRGFRVPAVHLWQDASGTWLESEGARQDSHDDTIGSIVSGLVRSRGPYERVSSRTLIGRDGTMHAYPEVEKWDCAKITPEESTLSAWDRAGDLLEEGWRLEVNGELFDSREGRKLLELGVGELDVVEVRNDGKIRYVELTGDLARVFDGLF